jgi:ABC-type transport system involved in multi-copper enzyme maturation permease subunit
MNVHGRRVRAIIRKELREYRRNRSLIGAMAIIPALFCVQPLVSVFSLAASSAGSLQHEHVLLFMLGIPAFTPAFVAAYSVVGERQQGTLEPMLTTPIRRRELLLGKALAALLPSVVVAYAVFAVFLGLVELFARPAIASALIQAPDLLAQVVFTPLLAGWSIWVSIAISTRSSDIRVAQQLSALTALPTVAITTLLALGVIPATFGVAAVGALILLVLNRVGWRVTTRLFDRERLIASIR